MKNELDLHLQDARIGVIAALDKEFAAATGVLDCSREVPLPGRGAIQTCALSRVPSKHGGDHVVVVAMLPDMGNNSAAAAAAQLLAACPNVRYLVMCGIAGAIPNPTKVAEHVRLGDIVVSDRGGVIQYDYDKETPTETELRHPPRPPAAALLHAVKRLRAGEYLDRFPWELIIDDFVAQYGQKWRRPSEEDDRLLDSEDGTPPIEHPDDPDRRPGRPRVFLGQIGSASKLLKHPAKRDRLRDIHGVKAVEMEGAGIADATWHFDTGYLVVRGTCDYCNPDKNDKWQMHAALIAAAYTRSVIEELLVWTETAIIPEPLRPQAAAQQPDAADSAVHLTGRSVQLFQNCTIVVQQSSAAPDSAVDAASLLQRIDTGPGEHIDVQQELLIAEAQRRADEVQRFMDELDFARAFEYAEQFGAWLDDHELEMPSACISLCYGLLAEVEVARVKWSRQHNRPIDLARARQFIEKARKVSDG